MEEQPTNIRAKNISVGVEWDLRNIFNCERFGMGGIADSDFINGSPYTCMIATLMYMYKESDEQKKADIKRFIEKYSFYSNDTIEDIIIKQGEKEILDMINEFETIYKKQY